MIKVFRAYKSAFSYCGGVSDDNLSLPESELIKLIEETFNLHNVFFAGHTLLGELKYIGWDE